MQIQVIQDALAVTPPPSFKGKKVKIYYGTQVAVRPPTIIFFVNNPELLHFSYLRYLENVLRETFGFVGTPLRLSSRGRGEKDE